MAAKGQSGGGGYGGGGGAMRGGGGSSKSNVTKIGSKKTMGKTEIKLRAKTDKVRKSPAVEDMRKGNLDNLKKTFGKPKAAPKKPKLNAKAKATIGVTVATANAARINKNKKKSEPVPRNPRKQ